MKIPLLLLLTLAATCYACRQGKKPARAAASPDFIKAEALYGHNNDSSFYYFNEVVNSSTDSQEIAMAYNYMGLIQREASDYFGSQESLSGAFPYLNEKKEDDHYSLSSVYTLLGNNSESLKNYDAAIGYYDLALKYAPSDYMRMFALNGKAVAYQKKLDYSEAIKIYEAILGQSINDKKEYARTLSNMATVKWLKDSSYPALDQLLKAMQIMQDEHDDWGLNASFSHLADYHSRSRPDSALFYTGKMYGVAQLLNSPDDKLEALQKFIKLGPAKDLKHYANLYQQLIDSIQTVRNNAKNQFALVRYEAKKTRAENLELQVQVILQRILIFSIVILFSLIAIFATIRFRKRKQKLEQESQNAIRESQLKTSQKVHDVVANGLYSIMADLEHQDKIDKEVLLDKMELMYEKSRDISYEKTQVPAKGFQETVGILLASFSSPTTKVSVVGNYNELWSHVKADTKLELEQILRELMVNMKKHSQASNVSVRFERQDGQVLILYQDDGIGLSPLSKFGNGLKNTENRIKHINGQFNFEQGASKGLKVRISFPILNSQ